VFGFVLCCGGLCGFGGDSFLEGKFEGCFDFGFFLNAEFSGNEKPHSVRNGVNEVVQ